MFSLYTYSYYMNEKNEDKRSKKLMAGLKSFIYTKIKVIVLFTVAICLAFYLGQRLDQKKILSGQVVKENRNPDDRFSLINPLLTCEVTGKKNSLEFLPIKNKINSLISKAVNNRQASYISVYMDTRDGEWMGINTDERYSPASLLKVANMITVLKAAESDQKLLQEIILDNIPSDLNGIEYFKAKKKIVAKHPYTVDELLEQMIIYSDNNTVPLLLGLFDSDQIKEVYTDLGLTIPEGPNSGAVDFMTVKEYANFFRVLYNATYLNRSMSQKAMELLAKSDFPNGIRAGLPPTIKIAQKFGERSFTDNPLDDGKKELHDCGIIYYPKHPYLLCIMTRGNNFDNLNKNITDISAAIYNFIDKKYQPK